MVEVAIAPEPPPPEKVIVGAVTYPEPEFVITTPVMVSESSPVPKIAVPDAVVPPVGGELNDTVGVDEYPDPAVPTVTALTPPVA